MRQCQSLAVLFSARQNGDITNAARSTGQRLTKHHGLRVSVCSVAPQTRTAGHTQLSNDGFGLQLRDQRKKHARQLMPRRSRAIRHPATWCNRIQRLTKSHEAIGSVLCSTTAKAWVSVMSTGEKVLFSVCSFPYRNPTRQSGQSNPPSQSSYRLSLRRSFLRLSPKSQSENVFVSLPSSSPLCVFCFLLHLCFWCLVFLPSFVVLAFDLFESDLVSSRAP